MPATVLARVRLLNRTGIAKDQVVNDWVFDGPAHVATDAIVTVGALLDTYYNHIGSFIGQCITRTGHSLEIDFYNLTGHLDGSPHGSPVGTYVEPLPLTASSGSILPNEVAAVQSFTSTFYSLSPEHGPTATLPSTDDAVDQGAPVTHTGKTRPRARHRARIYLGPLNGGAMDVDASGNGILSTVFLTTAISAYTTLFPAAVAAGWTHQVWSRRDAAIYPSGAGWMDNRPDSQRRRGVLPTVRTTF